MTVASRLCAFVTASFGTAVVGFPVAAASLPANLATLDVMNATFTAMDASFPPKLLSFALTETHSVVADAIFVTSLASFAYLAASSSS